MKETEVTFTAVHRLNWQNPADRPALTEAFGPWLMETVLGRDRLRADLAEAFDPKNPEDAEPGDWGKD